VSQSIFSGNAGVNLIVERWREDQQKGMGFYGPKTWRHHQQIDFGQKGFAAFGQKLLGEQRLNKGRSLSPISKNEKRLVAGFPAVFPNLFAA
jgi:hypothetical protein